MEKKLPEIRIYAPLMISVIHQNTERINNYYDCLHCEAKGKKEKDSYKNLIYLHRSEKEQNNMAKINIHPKYEWKESYEKDIDELICE
jgi:hypothetical protein